MTVCFESYTINYVGYEHDLKNIYLVILDIFWILII